MWTLFEDWRQPSRIGWSVLAAILILHFLRWWSLVAVRAVHFRAWKTTGARVDNEKFLECRKSVWRQIRKAPKTFSKTIQFNKSYTNAYCEKTVRDIQKIIADSFVSGQNWSIHQIKLFQWRGSLRIEVWILCIIFTMNFRFCNQKSSEIDLIHLAT